MQLPQILAMYWRSPDGRPVEQVDADIAEELRFHIDMRTQDNVRAGMTPEEARQDAAERFGNVDRVHRDCRRVLLGDRIMLQRLQTVLIVLLLGAVVYLGVAFYGWQRDQAAVNARLLETLNRIAEQPAAAVAAAPAIAPAVPASSTAATKEPAAAVAESKVIMPKLARWKPADINRAFPRDAKLTEVQRLFREWSENNWPGMLDPSWAKVSAQQQAAAEQKLLGDLSDDDESVRERAIQKLAAIGSEKAIPGILEIAAERVEKDNADRCEACRALGILGDTSVVRELVHLTYHFNINTRLWAQISLVRLTGENFGRDLAAWKAWWEKQSGKPPISADPVVWTTTYAGEEWADPKNFDRVDREFVANFRSSGAAGRSGAAAADKEPPVVVQTVPESGDMQVDPSLTEIRVTFNKPMMDHCWAWCNPTGKYPEHRKDAEIHYLDDHQTCVMPVTLTPETEYEIALNWQQYQGFRDRNGLPAESYLLKFRTRSESGQATEICDPDKGVCTVASSTKSASLLSTAADAVKAALAKQSKSRLRGPSYPDSENGMPLEFTLFDPYGREVQASDYLGSPVLISVGACWCGGCQQEAEPLRRLEEKYRDRGLRLIRSVSYDNALPAWEFQKHYRLPYVQLLDPLRDFERHYNKDGWPFLILVDHEGKVVWRGNTMTTEAVPAIERVLAAMPTDRPPPATVEREGIAYMPATVERSGESESPWQHDRFPSLACADDGRMYVAFTTNRGGTQDVYLRVFDGQKWLADRPVAATEADEFDGSVVVDRQNRPWVAWASNAGGPQYNIFVRCVADPADQSAPTQLTHSDARDGTMHPRMAVDAQGRLWVTYYQWERLYGFSRDKEVYTRYFTDGRWSKEIHVSPEDIPDYEDHTDPVIAPLGDGVVIGWSWDFHRPKGYSSVPELPTIFLRKVEPGPKFERARAVSGPSCDSRPTIAVGPEGRLWCAWESVDSSQSVLSSGKMVAASVEDLVGPEHPGVGTNVSGLRKDICTPCLAASPKGDASLVWAELDAKGQWVLMRARWDGRKSAWSKPKTLVSQGNPRFPSAAYAKDGTLRVAYCAENEGRQEIAVLQDPPAE